MLWRTCREEPFVVSVSASSSTVYSCRLSQSLTVTPRYPLVNEGAKILQEGLALRASDIDIVWIYGYGFPRYRGGPMFWADLVGVEHIYETMKRLHDEHGDWLEPAPLLAELARDGRSFGDL